MQLLDEDGNSVTLGAKAIRQSGAWTEVVVPPQDIGRMRHQFLIRSNRGQGELFFDDVVVHSGLSRDQFPAGMSSAVDVGAETVFGETIAHAPAKEDVARFVVEHFRRETSGNLKALLEDYAANVDYFDIGVVDANFLGEDKRRYFEKWPKHHEKIIGDIVVDESGENEWNVIALTEFRVESAEGRWISGKAENILQIVKAREGFKIREARQA